MTDSPGTSTREQIMIADDDDNIVFAFRKALERYGHTVVSAGDGKEAIALLESEKPAVLFLDVSMPGMSGIQVLELMREKAMDLPVIVITGFGTMETAVRAVQLGAFEYLTKPLDVSKVRTLTERALEMVRLRREVQDLRLQLNRSYDELELIGNDPAMQEVYKSIGAITTTPNSTNVIIFGESGTGKELVARAIHKNAPDNDAPFVAINCTVLPETLLESELFGHEKGAFTGANERKLGKFEVADAGTLFLDEIGDMAPSLQQKLLRVLQERSFQRVGGHENIAVRARFVAATNRKIESEIKRGNFREDLYFRLNVLSVKLPALRERSEDIPILANHFAAKYAHRFGRAAKGIQKDVLNAFARYPFPGNIRELENMVARAVVLEKSDILTADAFPQFLFETNEVGPVGASSRHASLGEARKAVLEQFERRFVIDRLRESGGNVTAAAEAAEIERQSFQRLMKKFGILSQDFRKE
jgi:DNA-binding NtrC family response regulator